MRLLARARLYFDTARHLRPSQIAYRFWKKAGGKIRLRKGLHVNGSPSETCMANIPAIKELDFDPVFLSRFDVDGLMENRVRLLHHEEEIDWNNTWNIEGVTPLWTFSLHYCEYLLPLIWQYRETGDRRYLNKAKEIVKAWIAANPRDAGGAAWDPYVISMRIVNWLAMYGEAQEDIEADEDFVVMFNSSLLEQYEHISCHLEKDILANHYMENLNALVLLSSYFEDRETLEAVVEELKKQVSEQILPDGMHFELSPMYHKIMFESLIRAAGVLRDSSVDPDATEWLRLQDMADCLATLENGIDRTPLFNDSGDNVAKSRDALLSCVERLFGIRPEAKACLSNAGYYVFEKDVEGHVLKLLFDAGDPGPSYALGHAHADALSFEAFFDGVPVVVNSGTYAYQDDSRIWHKSAKSHNTVVAGHCDQHEFWASFRVAKCGSAHLDFLNDDSVQGTSIDFKGNVITRKIHIMDRALLIEDISEDPNSEIESSFYFPDMVSGAEKGTWYSPSFGMVEESFRIIKHGKGKIRTMIEFANEGLHVN